VSCQTTTATEWAEAVLLATGIFATSLIPFFLLVKAEHLTPLWVREPKLALLALLQLRDRIRLAAVDALLGLLLLTAPQKGATS
jgi:hypothetical protein